MNGRGVYVFETNQDTDRIDPLDVLNNRILQWLDEIKNYRGGNEINILEAALAFIDEHLCEELSLGMVADHLGVSPTYFSQYFKKMTNETFVLYRQRRRMERAKELLAIPHYKVIDIVSEVGYDSYPHFSRSFKKVTGYSPTEYRSMLGIKL